MESESASSSATGRSSAGPTPPRALHGDHGPNRVDRLLQGLRQVARQRRRSPHRPSTLRSTAPMRAWQTQAASTSISSTPCCHRATLVFRAACRAVLGGGGALPAGKLAYDYLIAQLPPINDTDCCCARRAC